MKRVHLSCLLAAAALLFSASFSAIAEPVFIRLADSLDEGRGYCLDLSGYDRNINWGKPIQAHTCKHNISHGDQVFESGRISAEGGSLYLPVYDVCLEAEPDPGAYIWIVACSGANGQQWRFTEDGRIQPNGNPGLCLTLESDVYPAGTPPGTEQYWHRHVVLDRCSVTKAARQQWRLQPPANYRPGPGAVMPD